MNKMRYNYHTHVKRCRHATHTEEEMILEAIKQGFKVIGMSDHVPLPFNLEFANKVKHKYGYQKMLRYLNKSFIKKEPIIRMAYKEKAEHLKILNTLKQQYKDKIEVLIAFECEYFEAYLPYYQALLDHEVDYLILGNHLNGTCESEDSFGNNKEPHILIDYMTTSIKAMETGLFKYFAHPDLFMRSYPKWDETCSFISHEICKAAQQHEVVLEINGGGIRAGEKMFEDGMRLLYPHPKFWEIAKMYDVKVMIGLDAHAKEHLGQESYDACIRFCNTHAIQYQDRWDYK